MKGILIPIEGGVEVVEIGAGEWSDLVALTGGDLVERVRVMIGSEHHRMYVDESGAYHQAINRKASVLYGIERHGQPIFGPAVIVEEAMNEDLEEAVVDMETPESWAAFYMGFTSAVVGLGPF